MTRRNSAVEDDEKKAEVAPGDLRKNKGIMFLKDAYIVRFRQPYFQGLPESVVPLLLLRVLAGYTRQWQVASGLTVVWLSFLLKYFTVDHKRVHLDLFRQVLGANFSKTLHYLLLLAYAAITLRFSNSSGHFGQLAVVYFITDLCPRFAPKSITFSEAFTLASLVSIYGHFCLTRLLAPALTSVGNPYLDVVIFGPWVALVLSLAT